MSEVSLRTSSVWSVRELPGRQVDDAGQLLRRATEDFLSENRTVQRHVRNLLDLRRRLGPESLPLATTSLQILPLRAPVSARACVARDSTLADESDLAELELQFLRDESTTASRPSSEPARFGGLREKLQRLRRDPRPLDGWVAGLLLYIGQAIKTVFVNPATDTRPLRRPPNKTAPPAASFSDCRLSRLARSYRRSPSSSPARPSGPPMYPWVFARISTLRSASVAILEHLTFVALLTSPIIASRCFPRVVFSAGRRNG